MYCRQLPEGFRWKAPNCQLGTATAMQLGDPRAPTQSTRGSKLTGRRPQPAGVPSPDRPPCRTADSSRDRQQEQAMSRSRLLLLQAASQLARGCSSSGSGGGATAASCSAALQPAWRHAWAPAAPAVDALAAVAAARAYFSAAAPATRTQALPAATAALGGRRHEHATGHHVTASHHALLDRNLLVDTLDTVRREGCSWRAVAAGGREVQRGELAASRWRHGRRMRLAGAAG